ncbi:type I restriction enzyme HsdR N-terminal domain-containing protein [Pedobacter rhizosphaerae]|uniref:Type I restriction enzyme R protein N terminus (HSDR_N) n=1 Tax=Pedobacter rhizosphaerae TaxID=390241 RepID=A0A1H9T2A4_9SPHI|nr:type I restriction enzyme HsdR N-terminal domain-containing protein [Pedobacter rhizosphaerae]SER91375.1 Type I restriction enzyme R protein N terminus (HSDR_N) [Pedobacter rhizosphaerae]
MNLNNVLSSEEDLRSKIVFQWLKDCGLTLENIKIEHTFTIRIGRGLKKIHHPRADFLVTNDTGQNLFIIEVKKPSHPLSEDDKAQALSYARLLTNGMAPFTILTNGHQTEIYDSITEQLISDEAIPSSHPYIVNGFVPSGDALAARIEALRYLICLSVDNLLTFCEGQVNYHMDLLKGDDLFGGKKYIPQLYVPRENLSKALNEKLNPKPGDKQFEVILILGPPQQGKTSFVCNFVEQLISEGTPCLFYPAVSLKNGLIQEIRKDLSWLMHTSVNDLHWLQKLNDTTKALKKKLIIVIDGWNELSNDPFMINDECKKLNMSGIQLVLSATSFSLGDLLKDQHNNLGHIGESAGIRLKDIGHLKHKPLINTDNLGLVQIGKFSAQESKLAKSKYSECYNVQIPNNPLLQDPFYLRLACEEFSGKTIPGSINALELVRNSILAKAERQGIDEIRLFSDLRFFGNCIIKHGRSFSLAEISERYSSTNQYRPWIDSAILVFYQTECDLLIDFYYTHELDYVISMVCKKWNVVLRKTTDEEIDEEIALSIIIEPLYSALIWFLSLEENVDILKRLFSRLPVFTGDTTPLLNILAKAIFNLNTLGTQFDHSWIADFLMKNLPSIDFKDNNEYPVPSVVFSILQCLDRTTAPEQYILWITILLDVDETIEEIGIRDSYTVQYYGEDIISYDGYEDGTSLDVLLFHKLIQHQNPRIARRAALILAYSCPTYFLEEFHLLHRKMKTNATEKLEILEGGVSIVLESLWTRYYGDMCPGWLTDAEPCEELTEEYYSQKELLTPIILKLAHFPVAHSLAAILNDLKHFCLPEDEDSEEQEVPGFVDPNQLSFDFGANEGNEK